MGAIRLAIINGTGPPDPLYAQRMAPSFCRQLAQALGEDQVLYLRGPNLFGYEVHAEANQAYRWLKSAHDADPGARLMLAGYSRGGSAAIMASEKLEKHGVAVDSLFLFDAVARHEFPGGNVIPANVRFSRHARRCHAADFVERYEGTLARIALVGGFENPIRPLFGNVGLKWRGDGDHAPAQPFLGSHGALGGVGWRFVAEDAACEAAVARWMGAHLRARGIDVPLTAFEPGGEARITHPSHLERWLAHNIYQRFLHDDEEAALAAVGGVAPEKGEITAVPRPPDTDPHATGAARAGEGDCR
jgi:hypothetical protein